MVRPDDRCEGGVDYLKLTVWATPEEVCDVLERGLIEKYGWGDDLERVREGWVYSPAGGRVSAVWDGGLVQVAEYGEAICRGDTFCSVEIKGAGCEALGNEGVLLALTDLDAMFRVRASRVDVMAHTTAFTPEVVAEAIKAGQFVSRTVTTDQIITLQSPEGMTSYVGYVSKPKGGMKPKGDRCLRAYDRRGPTRVELQMRGDYAAGSANHLRALPIDEWPGLVRSLIRHYVDFVDRDADPRPTRCPQLPWWHAFTEEHEKISVYSSDMPPELTAIGRLDGIIDRSAKRLYAGLEAYGADWLISRIERHGKKKRDEEHEQLVAQLRRYLGSSLCDAPPSDTDVPF